MSSPTLKELLKLENLPPDKLDLEIQEEFYDDIGECFSDWRSIARACRVKISDYNRDYPTEKDKRVAFLTDLKLQGSTVVTYRLLVNKLFDKRAVEDARKIIRVIKKKVLQPTMSREVDNEEEPIESYEAPPKQKRQKFSESSNPEDPSYLQFVEKIDEDQRHMLTQPVESDSHIRKIAEKMTEWEDKYDLFNLNSHEVHDITHGANKGRPSLQRIAVIHKWRKKNAPTHTYGKLLRVFVNGDFSDCATEIVTLLNAHKTHTS